LKSGGGVIQEVEEVLSILFFCVHDLYLSFQEKICEMKIVFVKKSILLPIIFLFYHKIFAVSSNLRKNPEEIQDTKLTYLLRGI
jgi:hypothetical protein